MKLFILAGIVFLIGYGGLGYMHEQVHVEIYRHYGIDSHVEYFSSFPCLVTYPDEPCPNVQCISDTNMNEVVGYPLMVLYVFFGLLFVILILLVEVYLQDILEKLT